MERSCYTRELITNLKEIIDEDIARLEFELPKTKANIAALKHSKSAREILKKTIAQMDNYNTNIFCIEVAERW